MSDSNIVREQREIYRRSFERHGDSPHSTFNAARDLQQLRFARIMDPLIGLQSGFSIHDVGAGLCDLHRYLLDRGIEHRYSGTEIVQEMVDAVRKKYAKIELYNRDILRNDTADRHDFVVLSGVFNIPGKVEPQAWQQFILDMIRKMYGMADAAIAFNFLTSYRSFTDPELHYLDPRDMLDFCMKHLSRFVLLDHASPLFECTMIVLRPGFVQSGCDPEIFGKYFRNVQIDSCD